MRTLDLAENYTDSQFVNVINEMRKANRDTWQACLGTVNGKSIRLKFFNLYIQIFDVDGVRCGGKDCKSVMSFVAVLRKPFEGV